MKRIILEIPDGMDDVISITAIGGVTTGEIFVKSQSVDLTDHNGDTLKLSTQLAPKWVSSVSDAYSKCCDDDGEFYE